jgi:hypothetical protein
VSPSRYPERPRESLRAEANRRGVSLHRVRVDRAAARGVSPTVAAGKARPGELPLSAATKPRIDLGLPHDVFPVVEVRRGGYDANRAYEIIRDVNDLLEGRLPPSVWDARWTGRSFGKQQLPKADEILASAQRGDVERDRMGTPDVKAAA